MRRLAVALVVGSLALAGLAVPAGAASVSLANVTVTGPVGQKPTVTFTAPYSAKASQHRELVAGTGDKLVKGAKVTFDYVVLDGRTGTEIENTYGKSTPGVVLDAKKTIPGLVKGLIGQSVGGRELIAIAPKEGLAAGIASSNPAVKKSDTVLFVVDVKEIRQVLKQAEGQAVPPVAGLPTVKVAKSGKPTITVPKKATAPTSLVVQPLIKGTGPVVTSGQTVTVQYTGVIWNTGKQFDSSWDRGTPFDTPIGVGQVIPGWDEGLVGQTVGSQVLLVVPPDKGYGASGQPAGGIKGTDTLVFVVDILDAF